MIYLYSYDFEINENKNYGKLFITNKCNFNRLKNDNLT